MDEAKLREELCDLDKKQLIELFINQKNINLKLCDRLEKVENQLDKLTDLDSLIESLPEA